VRSLNEYITEAKGNWSFSDYQRQSFCTAIGNMIGALGDEDDMDKYVDFRKTLSKDELKQFNDLFDLFDDEATYHKINSRMIKDEMEILKRFAQYIEDNDIADNDWDLIDAYEKILY
jgi:hypothetical protein